VKKLLLDMSSIMWTCLLVGKDKEGGREAAWPDNPEKKPVWINSAAYGFEMFVNSVVATMNRFEAAPGDVVMVFDGPHSKLLRQQALPDYKGKRDHHPDSYIEFDKLREKAKRTLLDLGALAVHQDGMEADDVLCFLSQKLQTKNIVVSNDGDLLVLQGPNTDVFRMGELNGNKYGPFPPRHITLYKALVGDDSDNIKGARNFGEKSFIDLFCEFGEEGLDVMVDLIKERRLDRLAEDVKQLPKLQRIIDSAESVYTSYTCAKMYPEMVHTGRKRLAVQAGLLQDYDPAQHDARLKPFYGRRRLVHAANYEEAFRFAMLKLYEGEAVFLDIETSTPEASDVWMEEKNRAKDRQENDQRGLDVFGSELTGLGLTFGKNRNWTFYFPVDHVETVDVKNVTSEQVRTFIGAIPQSPARPVVVQNASFELSILYQEWGAQWKGNGFRGFLPNIQDTKLMRSYENENESSGLKQMSKALLGYDQVPYEEVTRVLDAEGNVIGHRKMNQMTAEEVFSYGTDDTVCTAAVYNYLRFMLEIEGTWQVYLDVETEPMYLNALRFVQGTPISMERMLELEREDKEAHQVAWVTLRDYLIARGWSGTVCPHFTSKDELTAAVIKDLFAIISPDGEPLKSQVRTPSKLAALIGDQGFDMFANVLTYALKGEVEPLNDYIKVLFKGEPDINMDSPKQMARLLYETIGLPIRLRNKPTDKMREAGINEGNPRTDDLSLEYALAYDRELGDLVLRIVKAIQTMKATSTRQKMFYNPYRVARHWKDQLLHAFVNQCATVTRRYSSSDQNLQQLPKHPKHGVPPKFREVFIPHA
jgi:5'-3' exonuclease/DNA polymerase I-like protein with 3'-5' exonuclease and polymerase domains